MFSEDFWNKWHSRDAEVQKNIDYYEEQIENTKKVWKKRKRVFDLLLVLSLTIIGMIYWKEIWNVIKGLF